MLLCFNRGYRKQMAALLLQVISIGTTINFVVPYCCRCSMALTCGTEILLKPSLELMTFWTRSILTMHWGHCEASLSTSALGDTRGTLRLPCLRSLVLSPRETFGAPALMEMGQFALTFQSLETLFCLDFLIK